MQDLPGSHHIRGPQEDCFEEQGVLAAPPEVRRHGADATASRRRRPSGNAGAIPRQQLSIRRVRQCIQGKYHMIHICFTISSPFLLIDRWTDRLRADRRERWEDVPAGDAVPAQTAQAIQAVGRRTG